MSSNKRKSIANIRPMNYLSENLFDSSPEYAKDWNETKLPLIDCNDVYISSASSFIDKYSILENISSLREIDSNSHFRETREEINFMVHPDHPETSRIA